MFVPYSTIGDYLKEKKEMQTVLQELSDEVCFAQTPQEGRTP
jgi:hypothetical protein